MNIQRKYWSFARTAAGGLVLGLFAACSVKTETTTDSATGTQVPAPVPATPAEPAANHMTEYGYGPLRAGMTYDAAIDSLKGALKTGARANLAECEYVTWEGGPAGLLIMVLENRIARVETRDSAITTAEGARVGDTEEHVMSLYPGRISVSPHKYTEGHYLTVKSANAVDTLNLLVFETDKGKVTTFRGGLKPAVEFVEGCS